MFDFQKEIIFNSQFYKGTTPNWSAIDAVQSGPTGVGTFLTKPALYVPTANTYLASGILNKKVYKQAYMLPAFAQVKIDVTNAPALPLRLEVFAQLSGGSQDAAFAQNDVYKGRPSYYSFDGALLPATAKAQAIVNMINFYETEYKSNVLTVSVDATDVTGNTLLATAVNPYIRFKSVEIQAYQPTIYAASPQYVQALALADYTIVNVGNDGFGTYDWMIRNLRLPTDVVRTIVADNKDELPIQGQVYNQYSFQYRMENDYTLQQSIVGGVAVSETTHVFYILDGAASTAFEAVLTANTPGGTAMGLTLAPVTPSKTYLPKVD